MLKDRITSVSKVDLKTKMKDLNKGEVYILICNNYIDKNRYFLQDGKVYLFEVCNFQWAKQSKRLLQKHARYDVYSIPEDKKKIFNV